MKKNKILISTVIILIIISILGSTLTACNGNNGGSSLYTPNFANNQNNNNNNNNYDNANDNNPIDTKTTLSLDEFWNLITEQPIYLLPIGSSFKAISGAGDTSIFIGSILYNNSGEDIRFQQLKIAYVAWDSEGQPLVCKSSFVGAGMARYINLVGFIDISVSAGDFIELNRDFIKRNSDKINTMVGGFSLEDIDDCDGLAIITYYDDFHGNEWSNPYYDTFLQAFDGQFFSEDMLINIVN